MTSRSGKSNHKRFPSKKNKQGQWLCRYCGKPVTPPKRSFCSPRCLRDFFMHTDWDRVRLVIWYRDGGKCMKCGKKLSPNNYHVDHIIPISKGGDEWELSNLELSCPKCNLEKGSKL